jgi:hypothetical protein
MDPLNKALAIRRNLGRGQFNGNGLAVTRQDALPRALTKDCQQGLLPAPDNSNGCDIRKNLTNRDARLRLGRTTRPAPPAEFPRQLGLPFV